MLLAGCLPQAHGGEPQTQGLVRKAFAVEMPGLAFKRGDGAVPRFGPALEGLRMPEELRPTASPDHRCTRKVLFGKTDPARELRPNVDDPPAMTQASPSGTEAAQPP